MLKTLVLTNKNFSIKTSWKRLIVAETRRYKVNTQSSKKYYERKLINLTAEQLFDVVADVDQYSEFVPWCISSKVPPHQAANSMEADLKIGFGMFTEEYRSHVVLRKPEYICATSSDTKLFHHLKTEWQFAPANDPTKTWVSFHIDFKFKSTLYNEASSLFLNEVAGKMVLAFENRCRVVQAQEKQLKTAET